MFLALTSILRHALTAGAGYLVARGYLPEPVANELVVALTVLGAAAWSQAEKWYENRKKAQAVKEAIDEADTTGDRTVALERLRDAGLIRK
jgi:hypothetical protein